MSSSRLVLVVMALGLAVVRHAAGDVPTAAPPAGQDQENCVTDHFTQARVTIDALEQLAEPAVPYQQPPDVRHAVHRRRRVRPVPTPTPWAVKELGPFKRATVYGLFVVTAYETGPKSFDVSVISDNFAEYVEVKDSNTGQVLAHSSLDDEKLFRISVHYPLTPDVELSVAVTDPNDSSNINRAVLPVLPGGAGPGGQP